MQLIFVLTSLFSAISFANTNQTFTCDSTDSLERQSVFELNVDTGVIKLKSTQVPNTKWKILYSDDIACGHKISTSVTCTRQLQHNFGKPNKPYAAAADSMRCVLRGKPEIQLNGDLEINRFGDGTGIFVCGTLSSNSLMLKSCKVVEQQN